MNQRHSTPRAANCSPVFSIAGVMPGGPEMAWKTAYPNPDAGHTSLRHGCHGPSFSMAGAMPGGSQTNWRTAMPDPTRDMIDDHGHVIAIAEDEARRAFARLEVPALQAGKTTTLRRVR